MNELVLHRGGQEVSKNDLKLILNRVVRSCRNCINKARFARTYPNNQRADPDSSLCIICPLYS